MNYYSVYHIVAEMAGTIKKFIEINFRPFYKTKIQKKPSIKIKFSKKGKKGLLKR